jgi:flagellar hook-associated protein 3 FlgL
MRIANKALYDSVIKNLSNTSSQMVKAQEMVSTGKKINNLSDDPIGLVGVLDLRSSLANLEQMSGNISTGRSWLTTAESALTQVVDIITEAKELTVRMSSANISSSDRTNSSILVDGYLHQIIALSNSQVGGRYIFSGTNTEITPFELNTGETQVDYYGNDTPSSIKIGKDSDIEIGKDGKDIFGNTWDDNNIFKTLIDLKAYLQDDDISGIQAAMDNLESHLDSVNASISEIGGKVIRLDIRENIMADLKLIYTERKSLLEEVDIAEAIIGLEAKELAYNAALSASAKIMQLSLVDFL